MKSSHVSSEIHIFITNTSLKFRLSWGISYCLHWVKCNVFTHTHTPHHHRIMLAGWVLVDPRLDGVRFFNTLHWASGQWQVETHTDDCGKITLCISTGMFQLQTAPFGSAGASATFQCPMSRIFDRENRANRIYLDNHTMHGELLIGPCITCDR